MKKITAILLATLVFSGCSDVLSDHFKEVSVETYAESFDDVSKFSNVYEMWKKNINTIHIQAGIDDYTNTYLLHTMPELYSTVIRSMNKYEMKAYALLDNNTWLSENSFNLREVERVLNYNERFKNERFYGISTKLSLQSVGREDLETYMENLKEVRQKIDIHNKSTEDNLTLSININNEVVKSEQFQKLLTFVDRVVYEDFNLDVGVEEVFSIVGEEKKLIAVTLKSEESTNSLGSLRKLKSELSKLKEHESFDGFIIEDYSNYVLEPNL